jgi:acetyltransferase
VQNRRSRAAARELPPSTVLAVAPDRHSVRVLFANLRQKGRLKLAQDEATAVLSAYGIPSVPCRAVCTPEDAGAAAALLGFPAIVKLRRIERPGSGEKGGLVLGLQDEAGARMAARSLFARTSGDESAAGELGCLVQRQVGRARELMIRVADDAAFGPTIVFGQGGTTAEIMRDFAMDLPPLNLVLARALVARPRVGATLGGFRDMPAANVEAVAQTLVRVSQLIVDFPQIAELDVNPLFADADGVAVGDAWIRLREEGEPGAGLAISPYPDELVTHWSAGGERLTVRPIRPEDAEQHGALFRRLSPDDVRFRFFSAIRTLSPEQTARMTQVDYDREMAFVAIRDATGDMVGVSRLACEPDGKSGEFAVVVQSDMKGKGLATYLMRRLLGWAGARGVAKVTGQVLADNAPMLAFVRHLGFEVHRMAGEEDLVEAQMSLKPGAAA